ncbi:MAG: serine/threonine protein kinase [Alphaproteobacteria bacterium]|nr:serine/threonine protein kinase [Alphaproteobacteria bacterium]
MSVARRRFRIIKEIAEGGFGKVYLAEQISSDGFSRIVAVKLLHAKWSSHDEVVQRTRDEARLLGLIRHQHIVKVEDLTAIDGKCAIVMEYLEGVDLKWMIQYLKDRNLVFPRAALFEIILAAASALDAAYNSTPLQGGETLKVIHRDIKPSNVFVTVAGGVKVLDFGTARANFAEREAKTQALAFGSQGYMAPERMLGEEDTPAADIFSLGITLYELLTLESFGRIPPRPNKFQKKIDERVAAVKLEGEKEWVEQVRDTLRLMLSYDPKERPTAQQLVEIMEFLSQEATDTGLRRYCRTVVAEAKAALPDLETGDPLNGAVVEEDASIGSPALSSSGSMPSVPGVGAPPPPPNAIRSVNPAGATGSTSHSGPSLDASPSGPYGNTGPHPPSTTSGGGGKTAMIALAVGLLLLVAGIAAIVVVTGVGGIVYIGSGETVANPVPVPVPGPDPVPEPAHPTPAPEPELAGGRVISPDSRADAKRVPTVLTFGDPAGAKVEIKGPSGYKAEWDGKAPFDLGGAAGDGAYVTVVATASKTYRLKRFTVEAGKANCSFMFDPAAGEWTGGCN